jgi:hypothetical protein
MTVAIASVAECEESLRYGLVLILLTFACGRTATQEPGPIACALDSIAWQAEPLRALEGSYSIHLESGSAPKALAGRTVWLQLNPQRRAGEPLEGLAGIAPSPFPGVQLFIGPDNREEAQVWPLSKRSVPAVLIGAGDEGPDLDLDIKSIGRQGFAGQWYLGWFDQGTRKLKHVGGSFCARRTS